MLLRSGDMNLNSKTLNVSSRDKFSVVLIFTYDEESTRPLQ